MEQEQIDLLKQQLQQQEKRAALGVLSAGIAHEVQNPLNFERIGNGGMMNRQVMFVHYMPEQRVETLKF